MSPAEADKMALTLLVANEPCDNVVWMLAAMDYLERSHDGNGANA